jgi:hypothetical protein
MSVETALARMIEDQRRKLLELARRLRPGLTADDITQPHDYPELAENWHWNYEDGLLAGLLAAELAVRRALAENSPKG